MAEIAAINASLVQILRPVQTAQEIIAARQQQDSIEQTADEARKEAGALDQIRRFEDQRFFVEQTRADEFREDQRKLANAQEFGDQLVADRRRLIVSQQLTDFQRLVDQQVADARTLRDQETARLRINQAIAEERVERADRRAQEVDAVEDRRAFVRSTTASEPSPAEPVADEGDFEEIVFSPQPARAQFLAPPPEQPLSPPPEAAPAPEESVVADARTLNTERAIDDADRRRAERAAAERDLRAREEEAFDLIRQQLASAAFNPTRSRGSVVDIVG